MTIDDLTGCKFGDMDSNTLESYAKEADSYIYRWLTKNYPSAIETRTINMESGEVVAARKIVKVYPVVTTDNDGSFMDWYHTSCCHPDRNCRDRYNVCCSSCGGDTSSSDSYCDYSFDKTTNIITFEDEGEYTVEYLPNNGTLLLSEDFKPFYRDYISMLHERCCRDDMDQGQIAFNMQWIEFHLTDLSEYLEATGCDPRLNSVTSLKPVFSQLYV